MMVGGIKLLSCTLALVLLPIALTLSSHLQPPAAGHHDPTQSPPPGAQELLGVSSEPAGGRGNTTRNSEESHLDRVSRSKEQQTGHQQRVLAYLRGHGRFSSDTGHNTQQAYPGALPPPALTEKLMQMLQECQFPMFDEFRQNLELCPWQSTCADIESRSCSRISECRGCLGLYTCNIPLAKCELKGVSRKTDGFIQNTLQHWMA